MIKILESRNFVILYKFLYIRNDKLDNVGNYNQYYREDMNGYLIYWDYIYNKILRTSDDADYSHSDAVQDLPDPLRKIWRTNDNDQICCWGKTDYYHDDIRLTVSSNAMDKYKDILMKMFNADTYFN